jgi:DNA-binding CsgD family transcriptional regulator
VTSEERLLSLVGRIYDAAADVSLWPQFLEEFADAVHGTTTALLYYDLASPALMLGIGCRFDPEYRDKYTQYYNRVNPRLASWKRRLNQAGPESIGTSEERVELSQLKKTELYNDYLLPQDTVHQVGCIMTKTDESCSAFACLRPQKTGPFGPAEIELLHLLFPHLQRAVQLHKELAELEGAHRSSLDALDRLPTGVIFTDDRGRVLYRNGAAGKILAQNDGLTLNQDGLSAATMDQTRELRAIVAAAAQTARGRGFSSGASLGIRRPSAKRPFALLAMPASVNAFSPEAKQPAVILFVSDPETAIQPFPQLLEQLHGLTPAESRLAEQLMQGETLTHAAEQLEISHNTARTHLQRIYEKIDTNHQGDLIRVLLTVAAKLPAR